MFAYVCAATGWTWDYIGEHMTLPRLYALFEHWAQYPPVHITAAIFTGVKSEKKLGANAVQTRDESAVLHYLNQAPAPQRRRRPGNA